MRRNDREITDRNEILGIMRKCNVCRLAFSDNNTPYIVPMNFGAEIIDGQFVLYFHSAKQGRKLDIISENPKVCFEMDCSHKLVQNELSCSCTMKYESVIGTGKIEHVTETTEKIHALDCIMRQYSDKSRFTYTDESVNAVCILKLYAESATGKRNK